MTAFVDADLAELGRSALQLGLSVLIQSTLLIVAGLLGARALRRRGPALQSAIYRATLASVALTMLLSVCSPGSVTPLWRIALPPAPETALSWSTGKAPEPPMRLARANPVEAASGGSAPTPRMKLPYPPPSRPLPEPATRPGRTERTAHLESAGPLAGLYLAAVGLWGAVTWMLLAWLALCYFYVLRLRARSAPVREGDAAETLRALCAAHSMRVPALLAGSSVRSPFLTGLWHPAILLPASYAADFDEDAMRAILAHELMHMTRGDCAWNLLGRLACAVVWMQPLLWLLCHRMEQASEEVCDQAVIQRHCPPRAYATCLLDLAERFLPRPPERALGSGVVPDRSSLARRIQQILAGPRARVLELSRRTRGALAAGVLAAVIGGSFLISGAVERPVVAAPEEPGAREPAADRPPVSGQVLTPDGQPVRRARVFWVSRDDRDTHVHASVTTDDGGRYRFAEADRLRKIGENPQVVVLAEGWGLTYRDLRRDQSTLEVTVDRPAALHVPFLDPDGKPAVHLPIRAAAFFREGGSFLDIPVEIADAFAASTDGEGGVSISALPEGYRVRIEVRDLRYASLGTGAWIQMSNSPETRAQPIRLIPGASLDGRVTYESSDKPVVGTRVGAQGVDPTDGWGEAVTDADGRYHLTQLRPGSFNVALDIKGELARSWTARAQERLVIRAGEHRSGIDFTLIPGALLTGRVVAADTGEPVPGVGLGVYGPAHPRSGAWVQGATSGPDGHYVLRVPAGKQHLYIMSAAPPGFHPPAVTEHDLTVKDAETVKIDFRLTRGRKASPIQGRVLGPDGKPVARADVLVISSDRFAGPPRTLQADAQGAFTLEPQLAAKPLLLRARRGGMATPRETVAMDGDRVTLRLERDALVTLAGRVTDTAGRPIAGAKASLAEWLYESGQSCGEAVTDAQGRYTFAALWPNSRYSVQASAEGYGQAWSQQLDELRPGQAREVPSLALKKADQSVSGRVVDAHGDPVAGATVYISGRDTQQQGKTTDQEGRFRFDGVVAETVELQCNVGTPGQFGSRKVPAGTVDAVLVLPGETEPPRPLADDGLAKRFATLDGQRAPALNTVAWVNSPPRTLSQLKGKVVLINFWGVGCGPCMAELPAVQRTAERFASRGVVVVGLHDSSGSASHLQSLAKRNRLTYPMAVDAPDDPRVSGGKTFRAYGVQAIPTVAVIDREGKVAYLGMSLAEAVGTLGRLVGR